MLKKILISFLILFSFSAVTAAWNPKDDLSKPSFMISVCDFTPGGCDLVSSSAEITIENTLKKTIERFIIALGTIALFIMTIGAWLMILYTGEDERLTKWKTVFMSWLIAVMIALLSWLMVQLVAYLLYI